MMASLICGRPPEAPRNHGFMQGEENSFIAPSSGDPRHLVVIKPRRMLRISKGLTPSSWRKAFDHEGRPTNIAKLLGKVQRGGIHPSIRPEVWELLLGVWPVESTAAERTALRDKHRLVYLETLEKCRKIHPGLGTGKLAYAVNDARIPDARSSFAASAAEFSPSNEYTQSDRTAPVSDGSKGPPPLSPEAEQLGWGAKFLFDIAERESSPGVKEGQLKQEVLLEWYADERASEGEAQTQGLGEGLGAAAKRLTQGLENGLRTHNPGAEPETQGLETDGSTQGLESGSATHNSGAEAEIQGLGLMDPTRGFDTGEEGHDSGTEQNHYASVNKGLGTGVESTSSGAEAPGLSREKPGILCENPELLPNVTSDATPKRSLGGGLLDPRPEASTHVTSENPEKGPETTGLLNPGVTANPVVGLTPEAVLDGKKETGNRKWETGVGNGTAGPESWSQGLSAQPLVNLAGLGRVKTMVARIEQKTLEEAASREKFSRNPSSVSGLERELAETEAGIGSGVRLGGGSETGTLPPGMEGTHVIVEPLMEGAFVSEAGQLEREKFSAMLAAEPMFTGQAVLATAGRGDTVEGANSAGGTESDWGPSFPIGSVGTGPAMLTSASTQKPKELASGLSEMTGLSFGPGPKTLKPFSRSRSASVILTKRVTVNAGDDLALDDESYATPDSRFTTFSTPDAGFFTPDRSLSAFSTPRSAAYATPDEGFSGRQTPDKGFFTPERRGRSASASPGSSRVSKPVSPKPSDWNARKGGDAVIGAVPGGLGGKPGDAAQQELCVSVGAGVDTGSGLEVYVGPGINKGDTVSVRPGENTGAGVNTGGQDPTVNRADDPWTVEVRNAEGSHTVKGILAAETENGAAEVGGEEETLDGTIGELRSWVESGSYRETGPNLETGDVKGVLEAVVFRESRPLRSEPEPEPGVKVVRPQDADASSGRNAAARAGARADVSARTNADVSKSEVVRNGSQNGSADLLLVVENGPHLTALGQGPVHTAGSRAVTLGRVSVNPGEFTVEWTSRGGAIPGQKAPPVLTRKKRSLFSSNAASEEGETVSPGLVKTEANQVSVGFPAGLRSTGPEAERAAEWLWTLHRIVVDVVRTDRHLAFYDVTANLARMTDILAVYAWRDPEVGYCQGMSDLLSPFVVLIPDDADVFWCFERLMSRVRHNFGMRGPVGVLRQLDRLREIVDVTDPTVGKHLRAANADNFLFAFRMLLVMFRRELSFSQVLMLWEMTWAADFERNRNRKRSPAEAVRNKGRDGSSASVERNGNWTGSPVDSARNGDRNGTGTGVASNGMEGKGALIAGQKKKKEAPGEGVDCADDLLVYCVAAMLHHNRARLKSSVREMDDAVKLFNGMELRIDLRRCVESAIKRRKVFVQKIRRKGKSSKSAG